MHPGALEVVGDGIDNDCDAATSDYDLSIPPNCCLALSVSEGLVFVDDDGDGLSEVEGDCDDSDPATNPAASEVFDGVDNDCDGWMDDGFDDDCDGQPNITDCDPLDPMIHPGAIELPDDGIDQDCDGVDWVRSDATAIFASPEGRDAAVGTMADPMRLPEAIAYATTVSKPVVARAGTHSMDAGPVDLSVSLFGGYDDSWLPGGESHAIGAEGPRPPWTISGTATVVRDFVFYATGEGTVVHVPSGTVLLMGNRILVRHLSLVGFGAALVRGEASASVTMIDNFVEGALTHTSSTGTYLEGPSILFSNDFNAATVISPDYDTLHGIGNALYVTGPTCLARNTLGGGLGFGGTLVAVGNRITGRSLSGDLPGSVATVTGTDACRLRSNDIGGASVSVGLYSGEGGIASGVWLRGGPSLLETNSIGASVNSSADAATSETHGVLIEGFSSLRYNTIAIGTGTGTHAHVTVRPGGWAYLFGNIEL